MKVNVFDSRKAMGGAAGEAVEKKIMALCSEKDMIRMVFAAAPSQNEFLRYLRSSTIPWDKVVAFHMDEYKGLSPSSPALFANFLKEQLFDHLPFKEVHFINGNSDAEAECERYAALLQEAPIDLVCMGIGENGHIAFNDPPVADFDDPAIVKKVALDLPCRQQQVNDGCFAKLEEVPTHALTLTIPTLLQTDYICCVVPGKNKREALTQALSGPIHTACPASILRLHPDCHLFTDTAAYPEELEVDKKSGMVVKNCISGDFYHLQSGDQINKKKIGASYIENQTIPYFGPGLMDLQVNGVNGIDFNDEKITVDDIEKVAFFLLQQGVTTFFPTLITNKTETIISILEIFKNACLQNPLLASCIGGIHLEGPFISAVDGARGAHDLQYIQKPSWELISDFQEASGGMIKLITLAPELENASQVIQKCVESGIKVAIGHTSASPEELSKAVEAGASLSTHLGNAVPMMLPRHPNILWDQLAMEELFVSLIADGFHLGDSFLKVILKAKGEKAFLVSDSTMFCGMDPGVYQTHIGDQVILETNGRLSLKNGQGLLAGASNTLLEGVEYLIRQLLTPLSKAWEMASLLPTAYMELISGFDNAVSAHDLVIFTCPETRIIQIQRVYKNGKLSYTNGPENLKANPKKK